MFILANNFAPNLTSGTLANLNYYGLCRYVYGMAHTFFRSSASVAIGLFFASEGFLKKSLSALRSESPPRATEGEKNRKKDLGPLTRVQSRVLVGKSVISPRETAFNGPFYVG